MPNMAKKELKAVNKDIKILHSDKGNCTVVLDESKYKDKLKSLLLFRVYESLPKDPTAKVERKVQKILSEHKTALPIDLKQVGSITADLHILSILARFTNWTFL
jgi:hypothetical protein